MALYVNNNEIDMAYRNGAELDQIFYNNNKVWEGTVYITKPSVSGAYTFDTASHSAAITGYDANTMTITGTSTATAAGTYTVTFTPKPGYAWLDTQGTEAYSATWSIAVRTLTAPTLTGTTSFAFVQGATHSVADSGFNATYMARGGTWSYTDGSSYASTITNTVTWSLLYPASTTWGDGTTAAKSASWTIGWVNGTSHYSNDLYNAGWNSGALLTQYTVTEAGGYLSVTNNGSGVAIYTSSGYEGNTFHALVAGGATVYLVNVNSGDTGYSGTIASLTSPSQWTEISGAHTVSSRPRFGLRSGNTFQVTRIWIT